MKRILVVVLIMGLAGLGWAAGTQDAPAAAGGNAKKITLLTSNSKFKNAHRAMADKLLKEEGIEVEIQVVPDDQYSNFVKTKIASREVPDLLMHNAPEHYTSFRVEENFVDLSKEPWVSRMANPALVTDANGKIWAMPQESASFFGACYYNKGLLRKLGIENPQPKTYAEFLSLLKRIKKADPSVVPLYMSERDPWTTQVFTTCGFSFAFADKAASVYAKLMNNELTFSKVPEFKTLLTLLSDLTKSDLVNANHLSAGYDDAIAAIASGKAAMMYNGEWVVSPLESQGAEVGCFPIPWFDRDLLSTGAYCQGFFVPKYAKNVETARKVLNLWSSPAYMNLYYAENPGFPGFTDVNGGKINADLKAMVDRFVPKGKTVHQMNDYMPDIVTFQSELWGYIVDMTAGTKTPEQVLAAWDAKIADHMKTIGKKGW